MNDLEETAKKYTEEKHSFLETIELMLQKAFIDGYNNGKIEAEKKLQCCLNCKERSECKDYCNALVSCDKWVAIR